MLAITQTHYSTVMAVAALATQKEFVHVDTQRVKKLRICLRGQTDILVCLFV